MGACTVELASNAKFALHAQLLAWAYMKSCSTFESYTIELLLHGLWHDLKTSRASPTLLNPEKLFEVSMPSFAFP
jgi:hypothetical protein